MNKKTINKKKQNFVYKKTKVDNKNWAGIRISFWAAGFWIENFQFFQPIFITFNDFSRAYKVSWYFVQIRMELT